MGPVDIASPYLRKPEPTQGKARQYINKTEHNINHLGGYDKKAGQ
jgi:hypothetical protein